MITSKNLYCSSQGTAAEVHPNYFILKMLKL